MNWFCGFSSFCLSPTFSSSMITCILSRSHLSDNDFHCIKFDCSNIGVMVIIIFGGMQKETNIMLVMNTHLEISIQTTKMQAQESDPKLASSQGFSQHLLFNLRSLYKLISHRTKWLTEAKMWKLKARNKIVLTQLRLKLF